MFSGAVLTMKVKQDVLAHSHDPRNQEVEVGEHELKASLGYIKSFRLPRSTCRNHVSKQTRKKKTLKIIRQNEEERRADWAHVVVTAAMSAGPARECWSCLRLKREDSAFVSMLQFIISQGLELRANPNDRYLCFCVGP